jgi:hypothetical protein
MSRSEIKNRDSKNWACFLSILIPSLAIVLNLTLLYINSGAIIPAKAGIQPTNSGFRVKPGIKGRNF